MSDRVAIAVAGRDELNYGEWERRSSAAANGLLACGIRPGDHVVLVFDIEQWTDLAVAWAATAKVAAVGVPLGPCFGALEVARIVSDCAAAGVVCAPGLATPICGAWVGALAELEASQGAEPAEEVAELCPGGIDTWELLYDTGPMSAPRRLRCSHRHARTAPASWFDLVPGSGPPVLIHRFPVGSAAGQEALRLPLVVPGAVSVMAAPVDPAALCAAVRESRATCVGLTTAQARWLAGWVERGVERGSSAGGGSLVELVVLDGPLAAPVGDALATIFPRAAHAVAGRGWAPGPQGERRPPKGTVSPTGLVQESMLWQEQLAPGCMNLPPIARRLAGRLDVPALEASLGELARRHQSLRTTFDVVDGQAVQVVAPAGTLSLRVEDLSVLGPEEQAAAVGSGLAEALTRPVDLVTGPLFEPLLLRLAADEHLLVIPLHHSIWDDWSVGVFNRELSALYPAFLAGVAPELPQLPIQFTEFARRQREQLAGGLGEQQRAYWRTQLAGAPWVTQLPIGDPALPPGSPQPAAGPITLALGAALSSDLRRLARECNATAFMSLLAAFAVLVHRYVGQDDQLLASVVANRTKSQLEGLIGCFAKKVLLRVRLDDDPAFPDLVARVRRMLLESLAHQDLPYDEVVDSTLGRQAARHGLVPHVGVMFQGLTPPGTRLSMPGVDSSRFTAPGPAARRTHFMAGNREMRAADGGSPAWGAGLYLGTFLRLTVRDTADAVTCEAWGAFHPPAGEALLREYHQLLQHIVASPASRVSAFGPPPPGRAPEQDVLLDLGGFRIDRSRLEASLRHCAGVADVAVSVRPAEDGEPRLVAYVVADGAPVPTLAQLRGSLWTRLPGHAWPAAVVVVPSLPRRPSGAVDEEALPGLDLDQAEPAPAGAEGSRELGHLVALWEEVSGRPKTAESAYWQDFTFLEALSMARRSGLQVDPRHVARNRTLEGLASALGTDPITRSVPL